jgi:hypothetical protein
LVPSLLLIGCSGSGSDFNLGGNGGDFGGGGTTSDSTDDSDETGATEEITSDFSYYSLSVYEKSMDFSGLDADNLFRTEAAYPFIRGYLINPIVASTLAATALAKAEDYSFIVDDIEVDSTESFPILQKTIGSKAYLDTALVFDVSGSVSGVDFAALVAEAKAYVLAAQASADTLIANQRYVVWAFSKDIVELTDGFTRDVDDINEALDLVVTHRTDGTLGLTSNLHKVIVETIGRYKDDTYDFRDSSTAVADDNDLIDFASSNGVALSQMVLFSSGADTFLEMDQSLMVTAIQSQGFRRFEGSSEIFTNKPIIYYVVGGESQGVAYSALSEESETTVSLLLNSGAYSFSSGLIQDQIDAVEARIDLDNQYIYRAAFLPRVGDHTRVLKANSSVAISTLTGEYKAEDLEPYVSIGSPSEVLSSRMNYVDVALDPTDPDRIFEANGLVEITGPNGEFVSDFTASLAVVATFLPATRWVNDEYTVGDYAWSFPDGNGVGVLNASGSYTVTSITGTSARLQLENTVLGYTTFITISN